MTMFSFRLEDQEAAEAGADTRSGRGSDRIGSVVVAALTRTRRGLVSELDLTVRDDDVPSDCVVNFDNIHTLSRERFRHSVTVPSPARMLDACRILAAATGC